MAVIAPFKGLTYNFYKLQNLSKLVAPPYDVISEQEQDQYYRRDSLNVIRLILGKKKTGDSDWDNRYTRAADLFRRWEAQEALIRADQPSLYITTLTYDPQDGSPERTRWGFIALARIEDEGSRVILPHEKTFSAHKDDRLKLMRACGAQFSQIFGLYENKEKTILDALKKAIDFPPHVAFQFVDGTKHRMWILQSTGLARKIAAAMKGRPIFIADGHHRYETARNFRNIMRARYGRRPENRSYEYVMMYLTNMDDEGLTILPSHRLVKQVPDFEIAAFLGKVEKWFHVAKIAFSGPHFMSECASIKEALRREGRVTTAIAFLHHKEKSYYLFSLREGAREEMGDDLHPSLKKLDVLALSRFILQRNLGIKKEDLDKEEVIRYRSDMRTTASLVESGECQMAFLLNPTRIDHVKEIAGNALVMPRKSTYFYPKVLTGLVFNKIDPHETIRVP